MSADSERDTVSVEIDGLEVEIDVAPNAMELDEGLPGHIVTAIFAANRTAGPTHGMVTVVVDDDARIRELNRLWRGFDKPTNVLSFPSPDTQPGPVRSLGDIAISYETAAREASAEDKSFADHVVHLSVHGFLHLLGYDHESDDDAEEMEGLERAILARIGISDPYVAHDAKG